MCRSHRIFLFFIQYHSIATGYKICTFIIPYKKCIPGFNHILRAAIRTIHQPNRCNPLLLIILTRCFYIPRIRGSCLCSRRLSFQHLRRPHIPLKQHADQNYTNKCENRPSSFIYAMLFVMCHLCSPFHIIISRTLFHPY